MSSIPSAHAHRFIAPAAALTYDDVLLVPGSSAVLPHQVKLWTTLGRGVTLPIPVLAAAMDTVAEAEMAIAMARLGGLAVIHKNLSVAAQAAQVAAVKAAPVAPNGVTGQGSEKPADPGAQLRAPAAVDGSGRLLCAAAVGPAGAERIDALVAAGCDVVVIDTAHGHSENVLQAVRATRARHPDLLIVAGNVATPGAVTALAEAGADCVKVGIGPGSICTTRIVAGVGVPQMSAVLDCAVAARAANITVIADGGIKHSGDVVKALAGGAHAIMIGSLLAGTDEAPGDVVLQGGVAYKAYRGMGSLAAMERGSKDRYFQAHTQDKRKLVPEGVEARVPAKGPAAGIIHQLLGGLRAGMGYTGAATLHELATKARFVQITNAGLAESHVHDVAMTQAAPNYGVRG